MSAVKIKRETKETKVEIELELYGRGESSISTGVGFFDHLLEQLSKHSRINMKIEAEGDLKTGPHHLVEDVGITLGKAIKEALGEGRGIKRMGEAIVPMDEALSAVALDISGRGYSHMDIKFSRKEIAEFPLELIPHFIKSLSYEAGINIHAHILKGEDDHHRAESLIKALAIALRRALEKDPLLGEDIPSTKGKLL